MSCSSFEPKAIIARFQGGEWLDNTVYWLTYRDIWQDQAEVIRLAENLRMVKLWNTAPDHRRNPDFKTQIAAFLEEHNQALDEVTYQHNTAYLHQLVRANNLLKKRSIEWQFYLSSQLSLGIIYLHEYQQQSHIELAKLRPLIIDWQSAHGETNASDNHQWNRALRTPRVKRLLRRSAE